MHTDRIETKKAQLADVWLSVLLLGSLWGFSEVVLGGILSAAGFPYRSALLTGVGMGLLAVCMAMFQSPLLLPVIALVAILCKQLVVPILHVSVMCKANSCLAVGLESLALSGVVTLGRRVVQRSALARIVAGAGAALLSAAAFYLVGPHVAPCQYLLSFAHKGGLPAFLIAEGLPWAVFSALLFPAGYWLGERLKQAAPVLKAKRPCVYYATNAVLITGSWLASAAAIAAGF